MSNAKKFDSEKADLSLCPLPALELMARAFQYGEKKYGRMNYLEGGMASSRLVAAAMRHILAWETGEDNDAESGVSHLGHALACITMLAHQIAEGTAVDNRRKKVPAPAEAVFSQKQMDEYLKLLAHATTVSR